MKLSENHSHFIEFPKTKADRRYPFCETGRRYRRSQDVTLSISNGTNGFQQLGRDAQTAGAVTAASSPTTAGQIGGAIVNGVGRAVEEASPAGTIDGSATLRITGNGNVTYVAGETRPYPSYAVYAYTVAAEGEAPKIVYERERPETPPVENLTKPKTAW